MELSEGKMFQGRANSLSKGLKVESTTGMFEEQYAILAGVSLLCWLWRSKQPYWGNLCGEELQVASKNWGQTSINKAARALASKQQENMTLSPKTMRNYILPTICEFGNRSFPDWASKEITAPSDTLIVALWDYEQGTKQAKVYVDRNWGKCVMF